MAAAAGGARRLRLEGLSSVPRFLSAAALAGGILAALCLFALAFEIDLPGGTDDVGIQGEEPLPVARVVTVVALLALAACGAALAYAAAGSTAWWRRAALAGLGVAGLGLGGSLVELGRVVESYGEVAPGADLFEGGTATVVRVLGAIALVAAVAVACAPSAWLLRGRLIAAAVGAAPFLCVLLAYLYVRISANGRIPGVTHPEALAAQAFVALVASAGFVVSALLLWQAVVGARASRDIGVAGSRAALVEPQLVLWLLGIKLAWLALGYLDVLPAALGGNLPSWEATRDDDWLSWLIVAAFASLAAAFLLRRARIRDPDEREPLLAAGATATGLVLFLLLGTVAIFLVAALGVFPDSGLRAAVRDAGDWFAEGILESQVVVVYLAGVVGIGLLVLRRRRLAAAFLVLFFVWSLARAIDITRHGENLPEHALGRVELASLDTALTVAVAIVALTWLRRRPAAADRAAVTLVLVASTVLVYTGGFLGSIWESGAFYVGLIFPAAYRFLFEAESLNRDGPEREERVLFAVALASALLVIATVQIESGFLSVASIGTGALGRALLAAPFAAVIVAIALSVLASPAVAGRSPPARGG